MGIGILGNTFLYNFLFEAVSQKSERLDRAYLETIRSRINGYMEDALMLALTSANDPAVLQAVSHQERTGQQFIREALSAQERLNAFLQARSIPNVNVLILFDSRGLFVQGQCRFSGDISGTAEIRRLPLFNRLITESPTWITGAGTSIVPQFRRDAIGLLARLRSPYYNHAEAYLYEEIGLDMVTGVLREFTAPHEVFIRVEETGEAVFQDVPRLVKPEEGSLGWIPEGVSFPYRFRQDGRRYRLDRLPLENGLALYYRADTSSLAPGDRQVLYTVFVTALLSLLAAAGLGLALSAYITRPIQAIIKRVRKISEDNDFSFDPEIEKSHDEIGLIGRAVNEMSGNIWRFVVKTEEHYWERRNAEYALLQTQINPHFLYNTLDTIQWMAKLQNNPAIADLTRRLINLLRNIIARTGAGSANPKITLAEELRILKDYTEIMSVRLIGGFEVTNTIPEDLLDCRIPKLTLQPLVENAILHGIEPSGRFGKIMLSADSEGDYLSITVKDSGVGMTMEQIETIKTRNRRAGQGSPSLNNIGIANIDERLKLLYNDSCGLSFESSLGEYTLATIRILKER